MYRCTVRSMLVALTGAALALAPPAARAQELPRLPRSVGTELEPDYWVGLSLGYLSGMTLNNSDGTSQDFGYSTQIVASVEKRLTRGITGGISAGFSTAPLTFNGGNFNESCFGTCTGKADITQYLAFIHGGGGLGFHGLYSLEAGITSFSNFHNNVDDALSSIATENDFTFGFGGGLGYGFSTTAQAYVAESQGVILHSQGNNGSGSTNPPYTFSFRAGFRVGF